MPGGSCRCGPVPSAPALWCGVLERKILHMSTRAQEQALPNCARLSFGHQKAKVHFLAMHARQAHGLGSTQMQKRERAVCQCLAKE